MDGGWKRHLVKETMVRFGERLSLAWKICVTGQKKKD